MLSVGIDFGTSTTVAAISRDGWAEVVRQIDGGEVMPSCLSFMPTGEVVIGQGATRRRLMDPVNTLFSVKRIIGKPWNASEVAEFRRQYPFELEQGEDDLPRFVTRAGRLTAVEVTGLIVGRLLEAPAIQQTNIDTVTVCVPAAFDDVQRQAIVEGVTRAGFQGASFIPEPCAAGLAYRRRNANDDLVFVYDLGGGTFDAAIVKWAGESYEVLAIGGDAYLGGDDIDLRCANWVAQQVLEQHRWDIKSSPASFAKLLFKCEQTKIALSHSETEAIDLTDIDEVLRGKSVALTRAQIDALCLDLVRRTFIICDETMRQAGLNVDKIDSVVMSGGACHMPMILRGVKHYFGTTPWTVLAPDRVVAVGAAFHADGVSW